MIHLQYQGFLAPLDALALRVTCRFQRDEYRRETRSLAFSFLDHDTWLRFVRQACPSVHHVALTANLLDILPQWHHTRHLLSLRLARCGIGPHHQDVLESLDVCLSLVDLDLAQNPLTMRGLSRLAQTPRPHLETLDVSLTDLEGPVPDHVALLLRALRRLHIQGNRLAPGGLRDVLRDAPRLQHLSADHIVPPGHVTHEAWCLDTNITSLCLDGTNVTADALCGFIQKTRLVSFSMVRHATWNLRDLARICDAMILGQIRLTTWILSECPSLEWQDGTDPGVFLGTLHETRPLHLCLDVVGMHVLVRHLPPHFVVRSLTTKAGTDVAWPRTIRHLCLRNQVVRQVQWPLAWRLQTLSFADCHLHDKARNALLQLFVRGGLPILSLFIHHQAPVQTCLLLLLSWRRGQRNLAANFQGTAWSCQDLDLLQHVVQQCRRRDISTLHITIPPTVVSMARRIQRTIRDRVRLVL